MSKCVRVDSALADSVASA